MATVSSIQEVVVGSNECSNTQSFIQVCDDLCLLIVDALMLLLTLHFTGHPIGVSVAIVTVVHIWMHIL